MRFVAPLTVNKWAWQFAQPEHLPERASSGCSAHRYRGRGFHANDAIVARSQQSRDTTFCRGDSPWRTNCPAESVESGRPKSSARAFEHRARHRHSPDKMPQARIFSYADAHPCRLGVNAYQLPVNWLRSPVHDYHMDGAMRLNGKLNPDDYYEPHSFGGPVQDERFGEPPLKIAGDADRYDHRDGNDDYKQPGDLFGLMDPDAQRRLIDNIAEAMQGVPKKIVKRRSRIAIRPTHNTARRLPPAWDYRLRIYTRRLRPNNRAGIRLAIFGRRGW